MGLRRLFGTRDRSRLRASEPTRALWSPGPVAVPVVGVTYHLEGVARTEHAARAGSELVGVLVPEPNNQYDPNAVAVYVLGEHVGHLPRELAGVVHSSLRTRLAAHGGRLAGRIEVTSGHPAAQITIWIDPTPIGITADQFQTLPAMVADANAVLPRLHTPTVSGGLDSQARAELVSLERKRDQVEANYDRPANAWPRLERQFRDVAARLDRAHDPAAGAAWLGVARSTRYQKGRRSDTLSAYTEALRRDPRQVDGWQELIDYLAWAPEVATLVQALQSAPADVRPQLIPGLLSISRGTDRGGRMSGAAGAQLRARLLSEAEKSRDHGCLAVLYADAGKQAAKAKDEEAALGWWRRAIEVGCTEPQIVDRISIRLVQDRQFEAAAAALRSSLARPDVAKTVRERMERRLARCERESSDSRPVAP